MTDYGAFLGKIDIQYECEVCGQPDHYAHRLTNTYNDISIGGYVGPGVAARNQVYALQRLQEERDRILQTYQGVSRRKCPHCGKYQSWMTNNFLKKMVGGKMITPGDLKKPPVMKWVSEEEIEAAKPKKIEAARPKEIDLAVPGNEQMFIDAIMAEVPKPLFKKNIPAQARAMEALIKIGPSAVEPILALLAGTIDLGARDLFFHVLAKIGDTRGVAYLQAKAVSPTKFDPVANSARKALKLVPKP